MLSEIVLLGTTSGWQTVATWAGTAQFGLDHEVLLFVCLSHGCISLIYSRAQSFTLADQLRA